MWAVIGCHLFDKFAIISPPITSPRDHLIGLLLAINIHKFAQRMESIINSFYSFKHTDQNSHRPQRKDRDSHFQQFEQLRQQQSIKQSQPLRNRNKKTQSHSVLVRSKQEQELLTFLKTPDLPKIHLKPPKTDQSLQKNKSRNKDNSPLDKILTNKKKFTRTYFRDLRGFLLQLGQGSIKHAFDEVKMGEWRVRGYLRGDDLILKASHVSGRERYLKYKYEKYVDSIKTNYEQFVQDAMEAHLFKDCYDF